MQLQARKVKKKEQRNKMELTSTVEDNDPIISISDRNAGQWNYVESSRIKVSLLPVTHEEWIEYRLGNAHSYKDYAGGAD